MIKSWKDRKVDNKEKTSLLDQMSAPAAVLMVASWALGMTSIIKLGHIDESYWAQPDVLAGHLGDPFVVNLKGHWKLFSQEDFVAQARWEKILLSSFALLAGNLLIHYFSLKRRGRSRPVVEKEGSNK
jgi:hypothetical protein